MLFICKTFFQTYKTKFLAAKKLKIKHTDTLELTKIINRIFYIFSGPLHKIEQIIDTYKQTSLILVWLILTYGPFESRTFLSESPKNSGNIVLLKIKSKLLKRSQKARILNQCNVKIRQKIILRPKITEF